MKKTAGLLVLILLSTTACFQVTVPASKPAAEASAPATTTAEASAAPQPTVEASADDGATASRAEREGPRDHGWGESRSPVFERCMNSSPAADGVQPAMLQCAVSEETRQDDRLNEVYQEVMHRLDGDERDRLRDHQRGWIHERDQKCARDETGGTNAILEEHICKLDMTIDRRVHLERRG